MTDWTLSAMQVTCRCGAILMEHRGVSFPQPVPRLIQFTCGKCGEQTDWLKSEPDMGPVSIGWK